MEEAVIPTEKINGRLILFAAVPDTCRDSVGAAKRIQERRKEYGMETETHLYEHGTHMIFPECVPMVNFLTRYLMGMKECKTHFAEVKKTRADVSRKIEAALKEW